MLTPGGIANACNHAVRARRDAIQRMQRPGPVSIPIFRRARARARSVVEQEKVSEKRKFASSIRSSTPSKDAWRKIKVFSKSATSSSYPLTKGNLPIIRDPAKAEEFAKSFQNEALNPPRNREFNIPVPQVRSAMEKAGCPIKLTELQQAVWKLRDTAPGLDHINNAFIRELPHENLPKLLHLYNKICALGMIPRSWKVALIIAILKRLKPDHLDESYPQMSLLPCLAKVLEGIVKNRLYWVSERLCLFSSDQSGFRSRLSTTDQVARLENGIRSGLGRGKAVMVVFLDLKAAYDSVPHRELLEALARIGLGGPLLSYIRSFLQDRTYRVLCGGSTSNAYSQEVGLPQGSYLSPLLFNLYISDLPPGPEVLKAEYADDIALLVEDDKEEHAAVKIQKHLHVLDSRLREKGLTIRTAQTKAMCFSKGRNRAQYPIFSAGTRIEYVDSFRYLEMTLNAPRLLWKQHISLKWERGEPERPTSGLSWEGPGEHKMLTGIYRSLVLTKLSYGGELLGSASQTSLAVLDKVQNQCQT